MPLLYRADSDAAFERLSTWWKGGSIGRPALQIRVPRRAPVDEVEAAAVPPGWSTNYSTRDFGYRVNLAARECGPWEYHGEALPNVSPDLGPNCLALYLGCTATDGEDTVWFHPCIQSPETATFTVSASNFYWDFTQRLAREQLRLGRGKFLTSFPDLIEGLDTLAAMRGTEELLYDLMERPEWVHDSLRRITESYFQCYDQLYDLIHDERGGSHFWAWAPGRVAKLQCDFSAMISPSMFQDFMVPVLRRMTERLDYAIYHWDGPGAIPHLDHLLSVPRIHMIQWTAGAGAPPVWDRCWWPLYHRIVDSGRKVFLVDFDPGRFVDLKAEFGGKVGQFMLAMTCPTAEEAREMLVRAQT